MIHFTDQQLAELARIERAGGEGPYQWGDWPRDWDRDRPPALDRDVLDALVERGFARREGKAPSGLGGTFPNVQVTELGRAVLIERGLVEPSADEESASESPGAG